MLFPLERRHISAGEPRLRGQSATRRTRALGIAGGSGWLLWRVGSGGLAYPRYFRFWNSHPDGPASVQLDSRLPVAVPLVRDDHRVCSRRRWPLPAFALRAAIRAGAFHRHCGGGDCGAGAGHDWNGVGIGVRYACSARDVVDARRSGRGILAVENRLGTGVDYMTRYLSHTPARLAAVVAALLATVTLGACDIFTGLSSVIGYNIEVQKKIEVHAKYIGLENRTVAVMVAADMETAYEHPTAIPNLEANIAMGIGKNVSGSKVLDPVYVINWQHQHPNWHSMPLGEVMRELDVERVVIIDLVEYHLNPPGNRWLWDAVATANVGIAEADGGDIDAFAEEYSVTAKFPIGTEHLSRDDASEENIEIGLQANFHDEVCWLFYDHIEDKYPELAH